MKTWKTIGAVVAVLAISALGYLPFGTAQDGKSIEQMIAEAPATQAEKTALVAKLEARAQQLTRATEGTKGAHAALLGMQRVRVKKLIERIKAGETVDPQEIDALLRKDVHSVR